MTHRENNTHEWASLTTENTSRHRVVSPLIDNAFLLVAHLAHGVTCARLVDGEPMVCGREPACGFIINHESVSRRHAELRKRGTEVTVKDLGSKNGCRVNGAVGSEARITPADEVIIGRVKLVLQPPSSLEVARSELPPRLVIESPAMRHIAEMLARVATSKVSVLLCGETGTGKEVLARLIHDRSPRHQRPFVALNCGAIPSGLVESVLFGHERGAFTGAVASSVGVFEQAAGGTLLLDEIGELPLSAQTALLRVLETRELRRVGASQDLTVDVRVLAATHRDLDAMVRERTFRADLMYRLNTVSVEIPPLRERPEEIGALLELSLSTANQHHGRAIVGFDPEATHLLRAYAWPGNIRELKNAVDHAVVVTRGSRIGRDDLPIRVREGLHELTIPRLVTGDPEDLRIGVETYESTLVWSALKATGGNRAAAAHRLGIPLRTLANKIRRYGLK